MVEQDLHRKIHGIEIDHGNRIIRDIKIPNTRKRRYEIIDFIGDGSFAWVFLGYDYQARREVAIKVGKQSYESNLEKIFRSEAPFLLHCDHPNIVTVYDIPESCGWPVMVMERAETNLDLYSLSREFNVGTVLPIMEQICPAVDYVHSKTDEQGEQFIHRDVKPSNILIMPHDVFKIGDLGSVGAGGRTTTAHGTDAYRAPEGFVLEDQEPDFKPQSDVYSLGIVTFFLLTKDTPFSHVMTKIFRYKEDENFIPDQCLRHGLSGKIVDVIAKCTHPDYNERHHSAGEYFNALAGVNRSITVSKVKKEDVIEERIRELYGSLTTAIKKPRGPLRLTVDEVVEEQFVSYDALEMYVKHNGAENNPLYLKAKKAYDGEIEKDKNAILAWISLANQHYYRHDKHLSNELWEQRYEVAKILHMRHLADDDERCSLAQVRDGTFRKHYDGGMKTEDGLFSVK